MDDQNKVGQRLVMVRTLVLPALVEELIQFIPLLKLEYRLELQLANSVINFWKR
jgi:hypothetical protein